MRSARHLVWRILALAVMLVLVASIEVEASAAQRHSSGGIVTFAEEAALPPDYISPMESPTYADDNNYPQLTELLYRPLYWFSVGSRPAVNWALSVANPPQFSDNNTVVTISLKHWIWSDGTPITARDVTFWMNLLSAITDPNAPSIGSTTAPGPTWFDFVPGQFPINVVSYEQTGTYTFSLTFNASYNPTWVLYNELSEIFPIPQQSWDRLTLTGPVGNFDTEAAARTSMPNNSPATYTSENPGTPTSGALGVAQFLNSQSQDISTYASNPLWKVVDGPFRLSQFTVDGFAKFVPNKAYSGSPKPTISAFEELPYTSEASEVSALRSGAVDIGYIPINDLPLKASIEREGYSYNVWQQFGFYEMNYNFTSTTVGPIFRQLYFRQAFQSLVDQPEYIKDFNHGVGSVENGPVPSWPPNNAYESPLERQGQVYPYNPAHAVALLKAHGWTVVPGGLSYCSHPGTGAHDCGAGVQVGQKASFSLLYANGDGAVERADEMAALESVAQSKAGIDLSVKEQSTPDILGEVYDNCYTATPCNGWDIANYGVPNDYWPNYFPTGELFFKTGAAYNGGDYSDPTNDALIQATNTAPNAAQETTDLFKYEDYLTRQLPVVWLPQEPLQLTMYKTDIKGVVPQGGYGGVIFPEDYRVTG
jgi:peptide/nickel transport system substrate-binding protein